MKMREPHVVPLSRQATEILREVRLLTGDRRWVFPQLRNPERPMSESCLPAALRAMGYAGTEMSCHEFRSLASTQLHELGWIHAHFVALLVGLYRLYEKRAMTPSTFPSC